MATLTASNSVITLGVFGIFSTAQILHGFDVDDMFSSEAITSAETSMGVDARLSAGWVPTEKKTTFTLQADSISNDVFDVWHMTQEAAQELSVAFGVVILPAISKKFVLGRGFLTSYMPITDAKKLLQPRKYVVTWESILSAPF